MAAIAVIGGAGFIGRRLAAALSSAGHTVTIVDVETPGGRDESYRLADVRDRAAVRTALDGVEVVYNLAAVHRDDVKPETRYDEVNVAGAANVCEVCGELGIEQVIFISSVAVYGIAAPETREEDGTSPFNAYGRSKLRAEQVHQEWQIEAPSERSLVIVRPTVVFGEGNRGNVYELVRQVAAGRFVMVGCGHNRKSMAYVGNLSAFLVHVLGLGPGYHLFNYADKPDYQMGELVDMVVQTVDQPLKSRIQIPYAVGYLGGVTCDLLATITGKRFPISAVRVRKFCSTTTFATQRVEHTGFQPPLGLDEALEDTIRYEVAAAAGASDPDDNGS
ncbi:MAG: NAD-dependent epimerase/dehydratase family protein [Spirochaetaceae bacterium]|nr:NAD-dependent epimerase/dehydratase family protein [Spirochaetaceae bacterium]